MTAFAGPRAAILAGVALLGVVDRGRRRATPRQEHSTATPAGQWYTAMAAPYTRTQAKKGACGIVVGPNTPGVAHPVLPCGVKIYLEFRGHEVLTQVVDHGPHARAATFDVTTLPSRSCSVCKGRRRSAGVSRRKRYAATQSTLCVGPSPNVEPTLHGREPASRPRLLPERGMAPTCELGSHSSDTSAGWIWGQAASVPGPAFRASRYREPMLEAFGDSTRGGEWASVRLLVDGDRIVEADAPGVERPLAGLTLLEAAAVGGETLAVDALANALGPIFRAEPRAGRSRSR